MSASDPGRVKTPTPAAVVETLWRNCASWGLIMLRTYGWMPCLLENCIFNIVPMYEFSHGLDPKQTSAPRR
jgi:hypothetical protein